jgi:phage protein D
MLDLLPFPLDTRAVRRPAWRLTVEGRDVTREVSPMVLSVAYTDYAHGESDDVEIQFEDQGGRWRGPWRPTQGDAISLVIGYAGEKLLPCGQFEVDTVSAKGPPDTLTVKAFAAGPVPSLRTVRDQAYEKQTLAQIVRAVAARHGLRVVGKVQGTPIDRVTQKGERDFKFLARLAEEHGYTFSVRGDVLQFVLLDELEAEPAQLTFRRTQCREYELETTTRTVYRACEVSYHNVRTKQDLIATVPAPGVRTGDVYVLRGIRVTSRAQAEARARAALKRANGQENTGTLLLEGDQGVMAGINLHLADFGLFSGKYHVDTSTHRISRVTGYETELQVRRVD